MEEDRFHAAVDGIDAVTCPLDACFILIMTGYQPLVRQNMCHPKGFVLAPLGEHSFRKVRLKVYAAYAENLMDFLAVILKNLCQGACQGSCCLFVIPAVWLAAYFNIHHCHRKFCQQGRISFSVVYTRPVSGFCCHMVVLQPQFFPVLFHCQHEIPHESGFCSTEFARRQIPQRMCCQHFFRCMLPFMPCNHTGYITVGKILVHIRQIFIVVQTNGCLCGCKIKGVPCLIFISP